jgi:CheY-like chemotaxis protein
MARGEERGKILILSEMFEVRELIAQDCAAEGHMVVATGNPALIRTLIPDLNPDLVLLDLHLNKINPWKVMRLIRKMSTRAFILPLSAYTNGEGNIRLVIGHREEGESLSFQAFKREMNTFLNPKPFSGERKPQEKTLSPGS